MRSLLKPDWALGSRVDYTLNAWACVAICCFSIYMAILSGGFDLPPLEKAFFWIFLFPTVVCLLLFMALPMALYRSFVIRYGNWLITFGLFPAIAGFLVINVSKIVRIQPSTFLRKTLFSSKPWTIVVISGSFVGRERKVRVGLRGDPYGDVLRWAEDLNRVRQAIDPDLPPVEVGPFTAWDELNLPGKPAT